jgi:hypothetical protein
MNYPSFLCSCVLDRRGQRLEVVTSGAKSAYAD